MTWTLRAAAILTLGLLASMGTGRADTIVAVEHQIVSGDGWPGSLGNDGYSDYVVYTVEDYAAPDPSTWTLWLQRFVGGAPDGAPVKIAGGGPAPQQPFASGRFVVFCSFDGPWPSSGRIMIYDTRRGYSFMLGSATELISARIHGTRVVWTEGPYPDRKVYLSDVGWYGTGRPAELLTQSDLTSPAEIGDRFVVWVDDGGVSGGQNRLFAFDLANWTVSNLPNNNLWDHRDPKTSGAWVVWTAFQDWYDRVLVARNVDTGEERVIPGFLDGRHTMDGDLVTWAWSGVFVYRISTSETFRVSSRFMPKSDVLTNPAGETLVAYGGMAGLSSGIYVSEVTFVPTPVANAGPDQTVHIASSVTLDGSGSSDPRGLGALTYAWRIVSQPPGPQPVQLSDPSAVSPTFVPLWDGWYVIELTVTNTAGGQASDTVVVSTTNSRPVAAAGADHVVTLPGTIVQLDGTQSYDPDGDALTYAWVLLSRPPGSQADLLIPSNDPAHPTLVADVYGTYVAQLVVSDNWSSSDPDTVAISFDNLPPVANAGFSRTVEAQTAVSLDGSGSSDPNADPLSFAWTLVSFPPGSDAALVNPTTVNPTLTPDREGLYVAQLVVSDGTLASEPSTVQIQAVMTQSAAVETVTTVQDGVAALPAGALKNEGMRNALSNKLNAANADIAAGNFAAALQKLEHDILPKTNGCATSSPPSPDANDWIKTCAEQAEFYPLVLDAIAAVQALM